MNTTIGQRLRSARERADLTQTQVAARMGSSTCTVSETERDVLTGVASLDWIYHYAVAVGCRPCELDQRLASRRFKAPK